MPNPIRNFFLFCSGATKSILAQPGCVIERTKYVGIGATIFFTATLAALSGGYALFTVFRNPRLSVVFGLLWGLIIFNLDRFIVSSIRKKRVDPSLAWRERMSLRADEMLKALPRLILAIFISIVITRPIELRLFKSEIEAQIDKTITQERTTRKAEVNNEYIEIDSLEKTTGELRHRRTELEDEVTRRTTDMKGELQGFSGTRNAGPGPRYLERVAELEQAKTNLSNWNVENDPTIKRNDVRIEELKLKRDGKIAISNQTVDNSGGLLKQMEALSQLAQEKWAIFWASLFILLLFISLETAPILVKLFSSRGPYDDYLDTEEHKVYAAQRQEISDINDNINTNLAISQQINVNRKNIEQGLTLDALAALPNLAQQEILEAQTEIARLAVAQWKAQQLRNLHGMSSSLNGSMPSGFGPQSGSYSTTGFNPSTTAGGPNAANGNSGPASAVPPSTGASGSPASAGATYPPGGTGNSGTSSPTSGGATGAGNPSTGNPNVGATPTNPISGMPGNPAITIP